MTGTHQIVLITQSGKPYDKGTNGILINFFPDRLAYVSLFVCLFVLLMYRRDPQDPYH